MLVLKIALGIILAFVIIGAAQCVFAVALLRGITSSIAAPTMRSGGAIGLVTPARTSPRASPSTLPPLAEGDARLSIIVLDVSTGRSVAGVCIAVASPKCEAATPRTDANGRLTLNVPAGSVTIYLSHPDYVTQQHQQTTRAGASTVVTISMRRSG